MTKLVEEVVISSDVLVDVLIQVGFLDKTFVDGNVSRIDLSYGRDRVNTYNITVEKEVSLKDIEGEKEECIHNKVFDYSVQLATDPPQYKWECDKCGEQGSDFLSGGNKEVSITTGSGFMNSTPKGKLISVHTEEKVLSKKDAERLLTNIDMSDKSINYINDTLNKLKDKNESLTAQQGIKVDDFTKYIADEISKELNNTEINVVIDVLNNDNGDAKSFAEEIMKRIKKTNGGW